MQIDLSSNQKSNLAKIRLQRMDLIQLRSRKVQPNARNVTIVIFRICLNDTCSNDVFNDIFEGEAYCYSGHL